MLALVTVHDLQVDESANVQEIWSANAANAESLSAEYVLSKVFVTYRIC